MLRLAIFLDWTRGRLGYNFFARQLRDMKLFILIEGFSAVKHKGYAEMSGWTLSRAHAKSRDATTIKG